MCTQQDALEILKETHRRCKALLPEIKTAYLYGSYARGDFHAESDVDILMTADLTQKEIENRCMEIAKISSDISLTYDVTVSVCVKPERSFADYTSVLPFYRNVLNEGISYG